MNEARNDDDFCAEAVPNGLTGYRRQLAAFARSSPGNKGKLAGLLSRQIRNLERDPDNTALRELTLQTIRRLAATD